MTRQVFKVHFIISIFAVFYCHNVAFTQNDPNLVRIEIVPETSPTVGQGDFKFRMNGVPIDGALYDSVSFTKGKGSMSHGDRTQYNYKGEDGCIKLEVGLRILRSSYNEFTFSNSNKVRLKIFNDNQLTYNEILDPGTRALPIPAR